MIADDWIRIQFITLYFSEFYELIISGTPELRTNYTFSSSLKMYEKLLGKFNQLALNSYKTKLQHRKHESSITMWFSSFITALHPIDAPLPCETISERCSTDFEWG